MRAVAHRSFRDLLIDRTSRSPIGRPPPAQVPSFVDRALERARGYRIETEEGVTAYLDLMLRLGAHFDEAPERAEATRILAGPGEEWERINLVRIDVEGPPPACAQAAAAR